MLDSAFMWLQAGWHAWGKQYRCSCSLLLRTGMTRYVLLVLVGVQLTRSFTICTQYGIELVGQVKV